MKKILLAIVLALAARAHATISNVTVVRHSSSSVTLSWVTDVMATYPSVSFSAGTVGSCAYTSNFTGDNICGYTQTLVVTGLAAGTTYCFRPYDTYCFGGYIDQSPVTVQETTNSSDTPTSTPTISATYTPSPTWSPTITSSFTSSQTFTFSPTASSTRSPTISPTFTKSPTPSYTPTPSRTSTHPWTPTVTLTKTYTDTPTRTSTPTFTATLTRTPTWSPTSTPTATRTATRTSTQTFTPNFTHTNTPTVTRTATPTASRTSTPNWTATATATASPTPTSTPVASYRIYGDATEKFLFTTTGGFQTIILNTHKLVANDPAIYNVYFLNLTSGTGRTDVAAVAPADSLLFSVNSGEAAIYVSGPSQLTLEIPNGIYTPGDNFLVVVSYMTLN